MGHAVSAARRPNILFLMADQMQGRVLAPEHPCQTPVFDQLAARGVRVTRAYTPNPVCSPARASLMTGLLPHSHGVLQVTHCVDDDQCVLRTEKRHWAQCLTEAGYRTGYFGKWHVERSNELAGFGWQVSDLSTRPAEGRGAAAPAGPSLALAEPEGYAPSLLYGVVDRPAAERGMGTVTRHAASFLEEALASAQPWCCFVSVVEPHDPYVTSREAFARYDVDALPVPPNWDDDLAGRPGLYRKSARAFAAMTERQKKEAAACYYASITEIDAQFGRLIAMVEAAGQTENTLVVLTSDHGDFLGAHGLYTKNISAYEEAYHVPLLVAGPGVASGVVSNARVGLHDLGPTLTELAGVAPFATPEARSFAPALRDPAGRSAEYRQGYAEYFGTRYWLTQRVLWDGNWKLVWNGFDCDELYDLEADPYEMHNRVDDPASQGRMREMMAAAWRVVQATGDHALARAGYYSLRLAPFGPGIGEEGAR